MRAEDGGVSRQIVEAVHDNSHDNVEHDETAEKDEGDKVEVGDVGAAGPVGVDGQARGFIHLQGLLVAGATTNASHHDVRPSLAGGASEKHHESLENGPKVVVALDGSVGVQVDVAEELHAHDGVNEEKHHHQHHHVGQSLDGLDKGEEEDANTDTATEQFNQPSSAEKSKEANIDQFGSVNDAAHYGDEIEGVPRVFEVGL